jgi:TPR repeat protein
LHPEYFFRYGRVNEESANDAQALEWYRNAIRIGNKRHEQFAARAALQMGRIYEREGLKDQAMNSYMECLEMPAHDFQNSIDQLAKAGINRIEGK